MNPKQYLFVIIFHICFVSQGFGAIVLSSSHSSRIPEDPLWAARCHYAGTVGKHLVRGASFKALLGSAIGIPGITRTSLVKVRNEIEGAHPFCQQSVQEACCERWEDFFAFRLPNSQALLNYAPLEERLKGGSMILIIQVLKAGESFDSLASPRSWIEEEEEGLFVYINLTPSQMEALKMDGLRQMSASISHVFRMLSKSEVLEPRAREFLLAVASLSPPRGE